MGAWANLQEAMRKEQEAQDRAQREAEYKKEEARKRRLARYVRVYIHARVMWEGGKGKGALRLD